MNKSDLFEKKAIINKSVKYLILKLILAYQKLLNKAVKVHQPFSFKVTHSNKLIINLIMIRAPNNFLQRSKPFFFLVSGKLLDNYQMIYYLYFIYSYIYYIAKKLTDHFYSYFNNYYLIFTFKFSITNKYFYKGSLNC